MDLLTKFQKIKPTGANQWQALCPAHDDRVSSLHITKSGDKWLIKCHAGCKVEDVVGAMGCQMSDLFEDSQRALARKEIAYYDYTDEKGNLLYQVVRYEPKDFRPRHKGVGGEWVYSMNGVRRVLYNLPAVMSATLVYVVEGEKDCDNINGCGGVATTSGSAQSWKPEYAATLAGKKVVVIPDKDEPGYQYALAVTNSLKGKADVKVIILPEPYKDVSDFLVENDYGKLADMETDPTALEEHVETDRNLRHSVVFQWVELASGAFNVRQMWSELNINTPEDKSHLRKILQRLCDTGVITKTAIDGTYRRLDSQKKKVNWQTSDPDKYLPIQLPFGIHELCRVYPKSIIVVTGPKNEGKTAFLMSCVMPNVDKFKVDFFNSETGPEQLKQRFAPLHIPTPAPFDVYERYDNFADVIDPTHLTIIDYLDFNSEVYLVGAEIDAIFRKLTTGAAIIGLQKPPPAVTMVKGVRKVIERDLAYGGAFSAKRACVYISMGSNRLKLVYVKTRANPRVNPNNAQWSYDFDPDGYFTNVQRYYGGDEDWNL